MINIKIEKKDLWLIAAIMVFLVGVAYVIAYGSGNPQIHGHTADEIEGGGGSVDRETFYAPKATRGTTTPIPESVIIDYCSDDDGCELRMGMYDWDGQQRTASRRALFYYNQNNKNWRSEWGDWEGTNNNAVTQHAMNAWSCYFTDGKHNAWTDQGDPDADFGLLSWNQYDAECRLTITD